MSFLRGLYNWTFALILIWYSVSIFFVTLYGVTKSMVEFNCHHKRPGDVVHKFSQTAVYFMEDEIDNFSYNFNSSEKGKQDICISWFNEDVPEFLNKTVRYIVEENYIEYSCINAPITIYPGNQINRFKVDKNGFAYSSGFYVESQYYESCLSTCTLTHRVKNCDIRDSVARQFFKVYYAFLSFSVFVYILLTFIYPLRRLFHKILDFLEINCPDILAFCNPITRRQFKKNKNDDFVTLVQSADVAKQGNVKYSSGNRCTVYIDNDCKVNVLGNEVVWRNEFKHRVFKVNEISEFEFFLGDCLKDPSLVVIENDKHFLSMFEILTRIESGDRLVKQKSLNNKTVSGEEVFHNLLYRMFKLDSILTSKLIMHNRLFFKGKGYDNALLSILTGKTGQYERPENCKNSQWKLYTSDCKRILLEFGKKIYAQKLYKETDSLIETNKRIESDDYGEFMAGPVKKIFAKGVIDKTDKVIGGISNNGLKPMLTNEFLIKKSNVFLDKSNEIFLQNVKKEERCEDSVRIVRADNSINELLLLKKSYKDALLTGALNPWLEEIVKKKKEREKSKNNSGQSSTGKTMPENEQSDETRTDIIDMFNNPSTILGINGFKGVDEFVTHLTVPTWRVPTASKLKYFDKLLSEYTSVDDMIFRHKMCKMMRRGELKSPITYEEIEKHVNISELKITLDNKKLELIFKGKDKEKDAIPKVAGNPIKSTEELNFYSKQLVSIAVYIDSVIAVSQGIKEVVESGALKSHMNFEVNPATFLNSEMTNSLNKKQIKENNRSVLSGKQKLVKKSLKRKLCSKVLSVNDISAALQIKVDNINVGKCFLKEKHGLMLKTNLLPRLFFKRNKEIKLIAINKGKPSTLCSSYAVEFSDLGTRIAELRVMSSESDDFFTIKNCNNVLNSQIQDMLKSD